METSFSHKRKSKGLWHALFLRIRSFGLAKQSDFVVQNLAVLVNAGMGVAEALDSVLEEVSSWRLRSAIQDVVADVRDGLSLSDALHNAHIVSSYTLALVSLGEQSGRLSKNLHIAAVHNEKERVFRSRVRSALAYSVFVLTVATVIGIGISWFILPQVASFFDELDAPLPALTRAIVTLGTVLRDYGFIILPLLAVVVILLFYFLFSFPKTRFIGHSILFHLPAISGLIKETEISRFGFIVGSMIEAGISLQDIFALLPDTTTFRNYKRLYQAMGQSIHEGHTFKQVFAHIQHVKKLLPLQVRQMIIGAEQSGALAETFVTIGEIYEAKVDVTSRSIPTFLEPILLLVIGSIVAVLALGILLPIYQLGLYL